MSNTIYFTDVFTSKPGSRFRVDGNFSGQEFFEDILKPNYIDRVGKEEIISIDLTGIEDMSDEFIDESFGQLSRNDFDAFRYVDVFSRDDPGAELAIAITELMMNPVLDDD